MYIYLSISILHLRLKKLLKRLKYSFRNDSNIVFQCPILSESLYALQ